MLAEINTISDIIYDIREILSSSQYKTIMECLMELNKKRDDIENELTKEFFKQHFFHSHKNNSCFYYLYVLHNYSIWVGFENKNINLFVNSQFLYSKNYNTFDKSIDITYARIIKIMPMYCLLQIDSHKKKVSNITLAKIVNFPYINIE